MNQTRSRNSDGCMSEPIIFLRTTMLYPGAMSQLLQLCADPVVYHQRMYLGALLSALVVSAPVCHTAYAVLLLTTPPALFLLPSFPTYHSPPFLSSSTVTVLPSHQCQDPVGRRIREETKDPHLLGKLQTGCCTFIPIQNVRGHEITKSRGTERSNWERSVLFLADLGPRCR